MHANKCLVLYKRKKHLNTLNVLFVKVCVHVSLLYLFFYANQHLIVSLSYLIILVLDPEALSQVSEHLGTVLFEFELSGKILSEEQR